MKIRVTVDGTVMQAKPGERLVDFLNRMGTKIPQVCYHPQTWPIQTCDHASSGRWKTGEGVCDRDRVRHGVATNSAGARAAQGEAFDRILGNHMLYWHICDNNNGNCTVHNTTRLLAVEHQRTPSSKKPYEVDLDQSVLFGRS